MRAKVTKSVGRPADIYSLGAFFYYLISGAYANPKTLYDAFRKFIEYEKQGREQHGRGLHRARVRHHPEPARAQDPMSRAWPLAPDDRFFSYKHYLDGNGELIDPAVMAIIGKAMIRNKPDSYCQCWDLRTTGISELVDDLYSLYMRYGVDPSARSAYQRGASLARTPPGKMRRAFDSVTSKFRGSR